MIDNFNIIKPLFYFNEGNDMFFHLQILRRGKDHPELPAANKLIQSWLVRSRDHLDKLRDEVVFLCEHHKARAYINVAGKDFDKLNTLIMKKLADNIHTGNIINPWHVYNSACGELKSRCKLWVVDVDTKDPVSVRTIESTIDQIWLATHPEHEGRFRELMWLVAKIPTMNGYHLITQPFDLQKFKATHPEVDVHKNNPTVLYVPDSITNSAAEVTRWRVQGDDQDARYCSFDSNLELFIDEDYGDEVAKQLFNVGNYFRTEEHCLEAARRVKATLDKYHEEIKE